MAPLPKSEAWLSSLVEQVPIALAIFDTEMRFLAVSPNYLSDIARVTTAETFVPADVIGCSLYETFPKFPTLWREVYSRALAGEKLAEQEVSVPREDGGIEWGRWWVSPWRTADNRIGGVLAFGEISTEQVQAKQALAESEAWFRATFENAAVGIAHLSPELGWLRANGMFCRIVGWPIDELRTKSLRDISHPDDLAVDLAHLKEMRAGKIDNYVMDKRYLRKDSTIAWGRLTVGCVRRSDGSIEFFVAVLEDICARKRAEQLLERQAALLDQSHDAIFTSKIGGGITYWNRGAEVLYGYPREEAIGRRSHDLLRTRARISMQDLEAQIAQHGSWYGELTHTARDGHEIAIESRHVRVECDGEFYTLETNRDVTARKRAEEELRDSEVRFRATFENMAVGITHLAPDGKYIRFNRAFSQLLGWPADELITKSAWEVTHPDDLAFELSQFKQLEDGRIDSYSLEKRILRKDGTTGWVRLTRSCVRKSDGSADYFVAVLEDISARKRAEKELAESESLFRATFENAAVGIAHAAPDGKQLRVNKAASRILGWPADELINRSFHDATQPDDLAQELVYMQQMHEGTIDSYTMDKRFVRKDGAIIWGKTTVSAVHRDDGSIDYFVGMIEDISARKRAEEELRKSEERFRSSILHSPVPIMLFDDREQILAVSRSWLTAAGGYSSAELHRMEDWTTRAYGERSDEILEVIRGIIATEPEVLPTEHAILTRRGDKRIWEFVTSALGTQSDGRRLFVVLAQDITERRAYEERIQLLMREARHRTKNILSLVQVIARQTAGGDAHDFIGRFTERIQALAANQDLLVRHKWQRIDIKDLIQEQLGHFADLIGTRINFDGPKVHLNAAAAQAIGLALHELATNAGKYGALSTETGRVDVNWRLDDDTYIMNWIERNGPPVRPPQRRGFGSTVIESMVKQTLDAEVQLKYAPSGLEWRLTCRGWRCTPQRGD